MVLRLILFFIIITSLSAKEKPWYSKIDVKFEAGMYLADFDGTHSTATTNVISDFRNDFGYTDTFTSAFGMDFKFDYSYIPNIDIDYFYIDESRDVTLDKNIEVVYFPFSGPVTTRITYESINIALNYEVFTKGRRFSIFGYKIYPGDIRYLVGINLKVTDWNFQIIDRTDSQATYKFIRSKSSLPLPYFGLKYYFYNLQIHTNVSAIALANAKTINYEFSVDYQVIKNLYLSVGFLYEDFKVKEKQDTIDFKISGNKFSFKYKF